MSFRLPARDRSTPKIQAFTSQALSLSFKKRFRHSKPALTPDDAPQLLPRNSDVYATILDGLYIIGNYPWSHDPSPSVLFSYPPSDPCATPYLSFLIPDGCPYHSHTFTASSEVFQMLYDSDSVSKGTFRVLYFRDDPISPYFFTYRFWVGPLTLPAITHSLSLQELTAHVSRDSYPLTEICIAIKTRFPFYDLFYNFIIWLLESETVSRMEVCDLVEQHLNGERVVPRRSSWPECPRLIGDLAAFAALQPPEENESILIDSPPSRVFRWRRPKVRKSYFPLGQRALQDVVKFTNFRAFMQLFSALLLEKTIVVYHPDEAVVGHVILALHFMLRPLRWASGSVSVLPRKLADLLDAPNPLLVGQTHELAELPEWFAYFDLARGVVKGAEIVLYPKWGEMEKELSHIWQGKAQELELQAYGVILECTNRIVGEGLLGPVEMSLMSEYSASGEIHSTFVRELYLGKFPREEREFVEAVTRTQTFQMQIEQDCRKRTLRLTAEE